MGHTWRWVVVTVAAALIGTCSAESVGFMSDADARACLARSYSVLAQTGMGSADPNEPLPVDYGQMNQTAAADRDVIVSYVGTLALVSGVLSALASLFVLALAGVFTRFEDRRRRVRVPVPVTAVARQPHTALVFKNVAG